MSNTVSIKIPKVLATKFSNIQDQYGFRSFSEFVLDATRRRLEYLKTKGNERKDD